jgi:hypothetical protein
MLVFVDESGDCGMKGKPGSSARFVVAIVVFEDYEEANRCDERIESLRGELGMAKYEEFHFSNCSHKKRMGFFDGIGSFRFWYYAFSVNKEKTWPGAFAGKDSLHKHVMRFIFENLSGVIENAIVKMDKCGSNEFRSRLARHLRSRINKSNGPVVIKDVKMADSATNNLIQLADMVCGAIVRSLGSKKNGDEYVSLIRRRSRGIRQWP